MVGSFWLTKVVDCLRQEIPGIYFTVVIVQHLVVDVRSTGFSGAADRADRRTLEYALAAAHGDDLNVGISSLPAVAMIDDDHVPVTEIVPTSVHHHTTIRGPHGLTQVAIDVDCKMVSGG